MGDRGLHEEDPVHQVELLPEGDLQNIRLEPEQEEKDELAGAGESPPSEAWLAKAGGQPGAEHTQAMLGSRLEFQTKVCEDFTITEQDPTR